MRVTLNNISIDLATIAKVLLLNIIRIAVKCNLIKASANLLGALYLLRLHY